MPRLPGQMAALSTHMDGVKANLIRLHDAIQHLAGAAAASDFSQRGDAQAFDHDFRAMVEQLNALMATVDGHLEQQSGFLRALASGDLGARLAGAAQGVFARIQHDANVSAGNLAQMVRAIVDVARGVEASANQLLGDSSALAQDSARRRRPCRPLPPAWTHWRRPSRTTPTRPARRMTWQVAPPEGRAAMVSAWSMRGPDAGHCPDVGTDGGYRFGHRWPGIPHQPAGAQCGR